MKALRNLESPSADKLANFTLALYDAITSFFQFSITT